MAAAMNDIKRASPWSMYEHRKGEQNVLVIGTMYDTVLSCASPRFIQNLRLDQLWPHLLNMGVLEESDKERIQAVRTEGDQVAHILQLLHQSHIFKFHAFMRCLVLSGQGELVPSQVPNRDIYFQNHTTNGLSVEDSPKVTPEVKIETVSDIYAFCERSLKGDMDKLQKSQWQAFYKFSLHLIFSNTRQFSQRLLDDFGIAKPFHVFLNTSNDSSKHLLSFHDEKVLECMAFKYIEAQDSQEKTVLLTLICGDRRLRSFQLTMFEILSQEANDKFILKQMVQLILLLQIQPEEYSPASKITSLLRGDDLHNIIKAWDRQQAVVSTHKLLLSNKGGIQLPKVLDIAHKVEQIFYSEVKLLQKAHLYLIAHENGTLEHVVQCFALCSEHHDFLTPIITATMPEATGDQEGKWSIRVKQHADVTITPSVEGGITVLAANPRDSMDALIQYRIHCFCGLLKTTINNLHINFSNTENHTEVTENSWTLHAWRNLMQVLTQWLLVKDVFKITVHNKTQMKDLFSLLPQCTNGLLGRKVEICQGMIGLNKVLGCGALCNKAGVELCMNNTCMVFALKSGELSDECGNAKSGVIRIEQLTCHNNGISFNLSATTRMTRVLSALLQYPDDILVYDEITVSCGRADLGWALGYIARLTSAGCKLCLRDANFEVPPQDPIGSDHESDDESPEEIELLILKSITLICTRSSIDIEVLPETEMPDLLSSLLSYKEYLKQYECISVQRGSAELEDVLSWHSQLEDDGVQISNLLRVNIMIKHIQNAIPPDYLVLKEISRGSSGFYIEVPSESELVPTETQITKLLFNVLQHKKYLTQQKVIFAGCSASLDDLVIWQVKFKRAGVDLWLSNISVLLQVDKATISIESLFYHGKTLAVDVRGNTKPTPLLLGLLEYPLFFTMYDEIEIWDAAYSMEEIFNMGVKFKKIGLGLSLKYSNIVPPISAHFETEVVKVWDLTFCADNLSVSLPSSTTSHTQLFRLLSQHQHHLLGYEQLTVWCGEVTLVEALQGGALLLSSSQANIQLQLHAASQDPGSPNTGVEQLIYDGERIHIKAPSHCQLSAVLFAVLQDPVHRQLNHITIQGCRAQWMEALRWLVRFKSTQLKLCLTDVEIHLTQNEADHKDDELFTIREISTCGGQLNARLYGEKECELSEFLKALSQYPQYISLHREVRVYHGVIGLHNLIQHAQTYQEAGVKLILLYPMLLLSPTTLEDQTAVADIKSTLLTLKEYLRLIKPIVVIPPDLMGSSVEMELKHSLDLLS